MMPIDKAKQLFNLYFELVEANSSLQQIDNTKQCALIAVDNIIEALDANQWQNRNVIDFYNIVKHEIEKI